MALRRGGIEYVEIRSLDLNIFDPAGINQNTMRFMEAFLIYCMLEDSPALDGLALAAEVRSAHPDLPVVLMTGYPSVESAVEALRAKVSDYITKPFNIHQLFKIIKSKLEEETA